MRRLAVALVVLALVGAACTSPGSSGATAATTTTAGTTTTTTTEPPVTTTTSTTTPESALDPDGLYLNLMWHQHQPLYPKDGDGVVTRPWVRVHATKDYLDMATLVAEYPDIHVTFNLTPVLMLQLEELANGTRDIYWVLSEIPAGQLDDGQKAVILERFFDTNRGIIARFPRYQELLAMRDAGDPYTAQDFRDLQVLFNLAWTDPSFLADEPLSSLVSKGRDFAESDKVILFDEQLRIIRDVIPAYAALWEAGQIEVTTTPLAHPILPLIADTSLATVGDPAAIMPANRFNEVLDAQEQVRRGLSEAERLLGRTPVGMWPGEGAVAQFIIPTFSGNGVEWVATGEDVLAPSLGIGAFDRDENDTVRDADLLYRPWLGVPNRNAPVAIFFRDRLISDLIGFQYSGMSADEAADDFMSRMEAIKDQLDEEGATGPHIVSVILDGENPWENYPDDGIPFLRALYSRLSDNDTIQTITPTEYLAAFGDTVEPLDQVFPGAWFSSNYATWIGEEEEAMAWDYLWEVRDDLKRAERRGEVPEDALAVAYETMLFAEGSDWFWWYGDDQSSGNDDYFDAAFRELLGQVYDALGQERPPFVSVPIIPERPVSADITATGGVLDITHDGVAADGEWDAAAAWLDADDAAPMVAGFAAGVTTQGLEVRVDLAETAAEGAGFDLYVGVSGAAVRATTLGGEPIGFGANRLYRWAPDAGTMLRADVLPPLGVTETTFTEAVPTGATPDTVEFLVPIADLGAPEVGDLIRLRLVERNAGGGEILVPVAGPAAAQVPDISDVEIFLDVADPVGDDHGPGTYEYPTDAVFVPGVYDLTGGSIGTEGGDLVVTLQTLAPIANPWDSPNGLSVQTFDIYIDTDPGAGTGARIMIPGRNAALPEGFGYEYGITVEGWFPAVYVTDGSGGITETEPTFRVITIGDKGRVVIRVPLGLLGPGDPATWGYSIAVMSQEGYPSSGVRRIRDVLPDAEQWRIGGAPGPGITHTRIMDVLWPAAGVQEQGLREYTAAASVEDLGPDGFGSVPVLTAGG